MSIRNIVNTIERKVIAAKNHSVGKESYSACVKCQYRNCNRYTLQGIWNHTDGLDVFFKFWIIDH